MGGGLRWAAERARAPAERDTRGGRTTRATTHSLTRTQTWVGTPAIYVFDCSAAGQILHSFRVRAAAVRSRCWGLATPAVCSIVSALTARPPPPRP